MRITWLLLLASTGVWGQSIDRGTVAGTGHHPVAPLTTEPKVVWETKTGYRDSTGMVASGNVLVTGNPNGDGGTYAYDLATGKRLWRVPGHIRGTPAVDETSAYAVNAVPKGYRFRLSKLDLKTGKAQWSYDDEDLGGGTPLLVGNVVVLVSENKRIITALDRGTGTRLWQHEQLRVCDARLAAADGILYFGGGLAGEFRMLTALDPATGRVHWSVGQGCEGVPAVAAGMVVMGQGRDLVTVDARSGAIRDTRAVAPKADGRTQPLNMSYPVLQGGVYFAATTTHVLGWEVTSGRVVFEYRFPAPTELSKTVITAAGGVLYVAAVEHQQEGTVTRSSAMVSAIDIAGQRLLWRRRADTPDKYSPNSAWAVGYLLPVEAGLIYDNPGVLVRLGS